MEEIPQIIFPVPRAYNYRHRLLFRGRFGRPEEGRGEEEIEVIECLDKEAYAEDYQQNQKQGISVWYHSTIR